VRHNSREDGVGGDVRLTDEGGEVAAYVEGVEGELVRRRRGERKRKDEHVGEETHQELAVHAICHTAVAC
jgi:hypothetical protein